MRDYQEINRLHIQRAGKLGAIVDGTVTPQTLATVYNVPHCKYCERVVAKKKRTVDHIVPLSRFGPHSLENLAMACRECNQQKDSLTGDEYLSLRRQWMYAEIVIKRANQKRARATQILQLRARILKNLNAKA